MGFNTKSPEKSAVNLVVHCGYETRNVSGSGDKTVLEILLAKKVDIPTSCGGNGTCGTCKILVNSEGDNLTPLTEVETEFAQDRGFDKRERLACQVYVDISVNPIVEITIPHKKD